MIEIINNLQEKFNEMIYEGQPAFKIRQKLKIPQHIYIDLHARWLINERSRRINAETLFELNKIDLEIMWEIIQVNIKRMRSLPMFCTERVSLEVKLDSLIEAYSAKNIFH